MKLEFDKRYPVPARPEQAWAVLADIRATAACWPGAALTTQVDGRRYQGTAGVQVGGEPLRIDGVLELLGLDAVRRELRLRGQGDDAGRSTVSLELQARIEPGDQPEASALVGHAVVLVDGRLAQADRHLLVTVGDRLLAQFAENFRLAAAAVPAPSKTSERAGVNASALSSAGADSTLTLMVEAGQAPGAAFSQQAADGAGAAGGERTVATRAGALGALRRWWGGLVGRGGGTSGGTG
ncbi:MAG: carbon monoxide dehydrogenase [Rubrivivax sp.]|nr:carbon monoxide dehydrogenase [Rubrivivax sp.]